MKNLFQYSIFLKRYAQYDVWCMTYDVWCNRISINNIVTLILYTLLCRKKKKCSCRGLTPTRTKTFVSSRPNIDCLTVRVRTSRLLTNNVLKKKRIIIITKKDRRNLSQRRLKNFSEKHTSYQLSRMRKDIVTHTPIHTHSFFLSCSLLSLENVS